jgi:RES domain-containing protein
MLVFRIGGNQFINDLSGTGAYLVGGRWNRQGTYVLYTGANIALCAWEYWVNLPPVIDLAPGAFSRITIEVPDSEILEVSKAALPPTWPAKDELLFELTEIWLQEGRHLCMKVPSAVIDGEFNYLINPAHRLADQVQITETVIYNFDERAYRQRGTP